MDIKEQAQSGDVNMILKYRKTVFYETLCPQYLDIPCLAIARNRGRKAADSGELRQSPAAQKDLSNRTEVWPESLLWHFLNVLQSTLYFISVIKKHSPGEITSLLHIYIVIEKKKHILPMLYAIAKLYCVCRRKQLISSIMYNFNATTSQSIKVIKIACLFKLKVSQTCSAVHNKINFLSV